MCVAETKMLSNWDVVANIDEIDSPALLFYHERIEENIRRTVAMVGGSSALKHLRPHIKTHKCDGVLRMQMAAGISKFKCATIAEAEMAAAAGAADVLLAHHLARPGVQRFVKLIEQYPQTRFACLVDSEAGVIELAIYAARFRGRLRVFLDIDCGQGRTGVPPDARAQKLYATLLKWKFEPGGLHAYDGHIHDTDFALRKERCDAAFAPVEELSVQLPLGVIVAGGTPTFPIHAKRAANLNVECSPGTNVFWDAGYMQHFPDLDFQLAALVLTRVRSKPGGKRLCLDLGHKAIASEGPHPRVIFPALTACQAIMHKEEHLVVEAENADAFKVGDALYGIPWHVCPTVALYNEATVIKNQRAVETWPITARGRRITI